MRYPKVASFYFDTPLAFNAPDGGVPLGRSPKNFARRSSMAKVQNSEEILLRVLK